jgi:hypothetical protein
VAQEGEGVKAAWGGGGGTWVHAIISREVERVCRALLGLWRCMEGVVGWGMCAVGGVLRMAVSVW